jgi:ribonuclease HII
MSEKQRLVAEEYIRKHALEVSVVFVDEKTIDSTPGTNNGAKIKGWHQALDKLKCKFDFVLVDGPNWKPYFKDGKEMNYEAIIKGDDQWMAIAAASIVAKNARDKFIREELCRDYPELATRYSIHTNVGYATPEHKDGLVKYGASQFHRQSCKDVKDKPLNPVKLVKNNNKEEENIQDPGDETNEEEECENVEECAKDETNYENEENNEEDIDILN